MGIYFMSLFSSSPPFCGISRCILFNYRCTLSRAPLPYAVNCAHVRGHYLSSLMLFCIAYIIDDHRLRSQNCNYRESDSCDRHYHSLRFWDVPSRGVSGYGRRLGGKSWCWIGEFGRSSMHQETAYLIWYSGCLQPEFERRRIHRQLRRKKQYWIALLVKFKNALVYKSKFEEVCTFGSSMVKEGYA